MKITFTTNQSFVPQLAEKLHNNTDTVLDLSGNPLGKRDKEELLSLIKILIHHSITSVNLSQTGLQLKSGAELVEILCEFKNTPIVTVNISGNWLGVKKTNDELKQIAQALVDAGFTEINLSSNHLGKVQENTLEEIFKILNHPSVVKIHLDNNQFDHLGGAPFVADFLCRLLGSKAVLLAGNDSFSQTVKTRMASLLEANSEEKSTLVFQ
ncbi:hypothetical protein [Legionella brunensis]|uniref:Leucine-rich repeat-and coiled coil-containing protein n=1 Tax=Legionella brunensis TaxID=29422 RepID=A0A0W0SHY9_9GAMM|nr:hypothetical protein [Legionella brunensis]KTC82982.1 Leucine-rich repeat-and coiled coil-containing protein [Legionella brunensis]